MNYWTDETPKRARALSGLTKTNTELIDNNIYVLGLGQQLFALLLFLSQQNRMVDTEHD